MLGEALPCPFCGGKNLEFWGEYVGDGCDCYLVEGVELPFLQVRCTDCDARGPDMVDAWLCDTEEEALQKAVELWNQRKVGVGGEP